MNGDDELAGALPDPPPPAPNRREATIAEAMRRFDGAPAAPPRAQPGSHGGWIRRPQVGALVTVGLIAVIGLPAAWMMASHQNETYRQARPPVQYDLAIRSNRVAVNAAEAPPPLVVAPPAIAPPARNAAPPIVAPPPREAASPPVAEAARERDVPAPAPAAPAEVAQSDAFAPEPAKPVASRYRAPSNAAALAPPPPPPAIAMSPAAPPAPIPAPIATPNEVVVTGARLMRPRTKRGDWNACTVDDPSRSLSLCRPAIDPARPGPKGVAAAHLADGLTLAWNGDTAGAIAAFDQAIAAAPRLATGYLNRSLAYARSGDDDQALSDADKAVRYAPDSAQAHYNRSVLLRRRGDAARAEADEERTVEIDPSYTAVIPDSAGSPRR